MSYIGKDRVKLEVLAIARFAFSRQSVIASENLFHKYREGLGLPWESFNEYRPSTEILNLWLKITSCDLESNTRSKSLMRWECQIMHMNEKFQVVTEIQGHGRTYGRTDSLEFDSFTNHSPLTFNLCQVGITLHIVLTWTQQNTQPRGLMKYCLKHFTSC